jgi:hypothetical protein
MLSGVALALSELPLELIAQNGMERRIHDRDGEREVQFLFADAERLLPVWRDGRLEILLWGNRRGESAQLPLDVACEQQRASEEQRREEQNSQPSHTRPVSPAKCFTSVQPLILIACRRRYQAKCCPLFPSRARFATRVACDIQ